MTTNDSILMGMDIAEIQRRIRKGTVILFDLAQAIDKLPDSDARIDLISRHDSALNRINDLENILGDVDTAICWFGFAPRCPGGICEECKYLTAVAESMHIQSVEEFDQNRIANARKYYKEMENG